MVDAAILSQWIVNVGRRDAKQRIAHLICEVATRMGGSRAPDGFVFDFAITQTQMADATGLTPVHVNRTLQMMRAKGLIEWSRGHVVRVPKWKDLVAMADFDPEYLQTQVRPEERLRVADAG